MEENLNMESLPTHILVQKQLEDVILTQQAAFSGLKAQQAEEICGFPEQSHDTVSMQDFERVLEELEEEKLAHARTQEKLDETAGKLEFALGEIEILQKQVVREKMQYEKAFGQLKNRALQETNKTVELENKCTAIEKQVKVKEDILNKKQKDISDLNKELEKQQLLYNQRMSELSIQKQQEEYINKVINGQSRKSSKKSSLNS